MTTILFPGQGSQFVGMGEDLFNKYPDTVSIANQVLGYSVEALCLEDKNNKLNNTLYTQPAIYVVSALSWLEQKNKLNPIFMLGHSVGEYAALFAAGVFDFETGLKIVNQRAHLMSQVNGGAMAACMQAYRSYYQDKIERKIIAADLFPTEVDVSNKFFLNFILKIGSHIHKILPHRFKQWIASKLLAQFPKENYDKETLNKIMYLGRKLSWFKRPSLPSASAEDLKKALTRYHLWEGNVILKEGWFHDSFPTITTSKLAILRVDADFYTSTKQTLEKFYDCLSEAGYCIIDDYNGFSECKRAVDEFRKSRNIHTIMHDIDGIGIYWQKSADDNAK